MLSEVCLSDSTAFPLGLLYRNHAINFTSNTEMLWNRRSFFVCFLHSPSTLLADYAIAFPNQTLREHSKTAILYFQRRKQCSQKGNVLLKFKFTTAVIRVDSQLPHVTSLHGSRFSILWGNKPMKIYTEDWRKDP